MSLGAYYHEKFRHDDRDLCLSITRTKAPKRSRVTPAMQKNKAFAKAPTNTQLVNVASSVPMPNTSLSAAAVSPTAFDDSPLSRFVPLSGQGPLHRAVSGDSSSVSQSPDHQSSSQPPSFPQQQLNALQQLDGSVAETCRWLINAGVSPSAFDPVAISDISHTTFAVPQLVSSNFPLSNGIPQQSTIIESCAETVSLNSQDAFDPLHFHNQHEVKTVGNCQMNAPLSPLSSNPSSNSLESIPSGHNLEALANIFDCVSDIEDDPLLTALLPGEQLPMVDNCLWAL